ncbi:LysR substrate-binding domain-containing protein [Paraburkholderia sp. RL17-347-BIC-D]|uniref:LysR substrate-binding domain-containing protein n=1 Tax=Paraburkholderia sp. RL17-347-BIC-D TaxID=3031632 RepID=UPI0038BA8173
MRPIDTYHDDRLRDNGIKEYRHALFNRNTRGLSLTEAGENYFQRILPAVRELALDSEELGAVADRPAGLLRINVARAGHMIVLQPVLRRFLDRYPEIPLDVCIENSLVDIVGRGLDAGIRFGDLVERDMVAIKVGPPIRAWIVACLQRAAMRSAHPSARAKGSP